MFDSTNLLTDQLGSIVIDANSSANITTTQNYRSHGTVSSTTGSWTTPFEFAGGYRDITDGGSPLNESTSCVSNRENYRPFGPELNQEVEIHERQKAFA